MRVLGKLRAYRSIMGRARRNRSDLVRFLWRRPVILAAVGTYETAVFLSSRVDSRLKYLATTRVSSLIGCPF